MLIKTKNKKQKNTQNLKENPKKKNKDLKESKNNNL